MRCLVSAMAMATMMVLILVVAADPLLLSILLYRSDSISDGPRTSSHTRRARRSQRIPHHRHKAGRLPSSAAIPCGPSRVHTYDSALQHGHSHRWVLSSFKCNKGGEIANKVLRSPRFFATTGLSLRVRLLHALPPAYKVDIYIRPGTHQSEKAINKQLNDKERVAAALENESLFGVVKGCLESAGRRGKTEEEWNRKAEELAKELGVAV